MVGRPKKIYGQLYRDVFIEITKGYRFLFATILMICPECKSSLVGPYGTKLIKYGRIEMFQCKNPNCSHLEHHKTKKQFSLRKSYRFKKEIWHLLKDLYTDLSEGAKHKTIAKKYNISCATISFLRKELEDAIESHRGLDQLVSTKQLDRAIAIDETFLKIAGKSIYIIIATGYKTHKTLGLKVSKTRKEADIRQVFDEAEKNTKYPITAASVDAWGASQSMAKNLNRDFTLIIHKHKKPYDKAVIRHFAYSLTERITTDIGVKTDVFKKRKKREYHYREWRESLVEKTKKPVGRPKGVKNGQGKKKSKTKKTRGQRGLFVVFKKGTRGYMKVDPYRKTLNLSEMCLGTVAAALNTAFTLYSGKTIQNNLAENINSVLQSIIRLKGPKTEDSVENRLRATLIIRNDPEIIHEIKIERNMHGKFVLNNLKIKNFSRLVDNKWNINGMKKIEVIAN